MDFFTTHISKKAKENINRVLDTTFVSAGKVAEQFENALSVKLGLVNPVSLNSGTASLHLALDVGGIKESDEVIIPPQTFVATGLAVLMQKAKPVFADIQLETGNISPESIREKITDKTKAIIPVHYGGYPCDMDEISKIAKEHNLIVIEDAAHSLGASYKGKPIGSISPFTCFSFQAIKMLTTGDGGALCCKNEKDYNRAQTKRWFGIDRKNSKPSILGERVFDISEIGYKYHMNDLSAAIGLGNIEDFDEIFNRRNEITSIYFNELKNVKGLELLKYKNDRVSSNWLFTIKIENRVKFIEMLKAHGIPLTVAHLRIDKNSIFGGINDDLDGMNRFNEVQVAIPNHSDLTNEEVTTIIKTIQKGW